jgi:hypothetical protein
MRNASREICKDSALPSPPKRIGPVTGSIYYGEGRCPGRAERYSQTVPLIQLVATFHGWVFSHLKILSNGRRCNCGEKLVWRIFFLHYISRIFIDYQYKVFCRRNISQEAHLFLVVDFSANTALPPLPRASIHCYKTFRRIPPPSPDDARLILLYRGKRLLYMGREFAPSASGTEVFRNIRKFPAIFTMKKGRTRMVGSNSVPLDYYTCPLPLDHGFHVLNVKKYTICGKFPAVFPHIFNLRIFRNFPVSVWTGGKMFQRQQGTFFIPRTAIFQRRASF